MRITQQYDQLLLACDLSFIALQQRFSESIICKSGCLECCRLSSVFAIEASWIADYWLRSSHLVTEDSREVSGFCPFLNEGKCLVYPVRPLICRTHGLAIAYRHEDSINWESCALTFVNGLPDGFTERDFLYAEPLTDALVKLNLQFMRDAGISEEDYRVALHDVKNDPERYLLH